MSKLSLLFLPFVAIVRKIVVQGTPLIVDSAAGVGVGWKRRCKTRL